MSAGGSWFKSELCMVSDVKRGTLIERTDMHTRNSPHYTHTNQPMKAVKKHNRDRSEHTDTPYM